MRRRTIVISSLLVALVAGGGAWWTLRGGGTVGSERPVAIDRLGNVIGENSEALLAKKRATRGGEPVDMRPASLAGHVRRQTDRVGVAGALVMVSPRQFGGSMFPSANDDVIVVVAGAAGAWTASVRSGDYVVSAATAGLLPASVDVDVEAGEAKTGIDLALEAGGTTIGGTVSDIGGGPIADARITVVRSGVAAMHAAAAYGAITGADGRYRLTLPDDAWNAAAGHADYTDDDHRFVLRGQPLTVDFTLIPGGTIRGQVVARDTGEPVAGARVAADGGRHGRDDNVSSRGDAIADANGNFTLRGVGSGAVSLRASGRGYASEQPTVVELAIGAEEVGVKVAVDRAYTIGGFVVKPGSGGTGIAGVRVGVFSIGDGTSAFALQPSDTDGYFEIVGVRPAGYLIAALGEGVIPEIGKLIAVVDRDLTDVLVTMDAGATLTGRVSRAAVARLSLEIDSSKVGLGNMFDIAKAALVHATTDATGAFTLGSVPTGTFTILAETRDGSGGKLTVTVTDADQSGLLIPLEMRGAISGRVIDAEGTAVGGVTVGVSGPMVGMSFGDDDGVNQSVTATDGSFRVAGLEPATIVLAVSDEHGPLAWADRAEPMRAVTIVGAEEVRDVTLKVEARDGVIRGVVVGLDRQPIADVWVTARATASFWRAQFQQTQEGIAPADTIDAGVGDTETVIGDDDDEFVQGFGGGATVLTGADGRFTIGGLRRGAYHVVAEATKGGVRAQRSGVKTGETVTLTLERLGALTVVVTAGGRPAASYDLHCHGPAADQRRKVASADGTAVIERLPPGTYRCDATADVGSASASTRLAGAGRLELALAAWASVSGVVVDEARRPRAGLIVVARGDGEDLSGAMTEIVAGGGITTDATGHFELGKVAAGKGQLMIFDAAGSFSPLMTMELTLVAGRRHDLGTLTLDPAPTDGP